MAPPSPTARHTWGLEQLIAARDPVKFEVWPPQVVPPLLVARMVPPAPTATHMFKVAQLMPRNCLLVPDVWFSQVEAPFFVAMMAPSVLLA
jgi:hypothetical protein